MAADRRAGATRLELDGVRLWLDGRLLMPDLPDRLVVEPGRPLAIMGPSGVGKSSLLGYVAGSLAGGIRGEGEVRLAGRRIDGLPPERRRVGLLFQDDLLFPHLSVGENLAFGLTAAIRGRRARRARVEEALADAGLEGFADRDPATLSGGQRARVALLRTLLSEPLALLLDEPFSRLDGDLRDRFRGHVFDHVSRAGLPTLLVTHDREDAGAAVDRGGWVVTLG